MSKRFISLDELAIDLQDKINGVNYENLIEYGLDKIFENTVFVFKTHSESGVYEPFERIENTVKRYINGSVALVGNSSEGINEASYNAVIQLRAEFLIPFIGPEEKNRELLNAIRLLLTNELKYSSAIETDYASPELVPVVYTHITDYSIANTGIRDQREVIGDSISMTIDITHTFVALGVSSNSIVVEIKNPFADEETWETIGYSKLGIARKSTSDSNVYSDSETSVPSTKSTPANTVLTVSMDLITRLRVLDYYVAEYTYNGNCDPIDIRITRPNPSYYVKEGLGKDPENDPLTKTSYYKMMFESSGVNAELDKISSSSVRLIEAKTF